MYGPEFQTEQTGRFLTALSAIPTGNVWLDDIWDGGINDKQVVLVGAKTGVGKTFFGTQLALHAARKTKNVVYFALEADANEIERRMLYYAMLRIVSTNLRGHHMPRYRSWLMGAGYDGPDRDTWLSIEAEAKKKLSHDLMTFRPIYRTDQYTPEQFYNEIEELASGQLEKPHLIILDHLHHFFLHGDELEALKLAIHGIRRAQDKHGIPIVVLAQLRKSDRGGKVQKTIPVLEDMRGTSALTDVATDVLIISKVPENLKDSLPAGINHPMFFHLAKSRTAPEANDFVAAMGFDGKAGTYSSRYSLFRARNWEDPEPLPPSETPFWAKHAVQPIIQPRPPMADRRGPRDD